jgi:hypothetical protein
MIPLFCEVRLAQETRSERWKCRSRGLMGNSISLEKQPMTDKEVAHQPRLHIAMRDFYQVVYDGSIFFSFPLKASTG